MQGINVFTDLYYREQALQIARQRIFTAPLFVGNIIRGVDDWAQTERKAAADVASGKSTAGSSSIQEFRRPFVQLARALDVVDLYTDLFEQPYLDRAASFYAKLSETMKETHERSPKEFLRQWRLLSIAEGERAKAVLLPGTWAKAERVAEDAFVHDRTKWLSGDGLKELFTLRGDESIETLRRLHDLLIRSNAIDTLRTEWTAHLSVAVTSIVTGPPEAMVDALLGLHSFATRVVKDAFVVETSGDARGSFSYGLDDAFEVGFRAGNSKPAEMIAKYIDERMRKGQKDLSDRGFDELLSSVLLLFRYTTDKDVFRTFYTRALAKRLLRNQSASNDAEKQVLQKLKLHHDPDFEKGLEMFKDLELSADLMEEFTMKMTNRQRPKDDALANSLDALTAMVLQQSAWPIVDVQTIELPEPVWRCRERLNNVPDIPCR